MVEKAAGIMSNQPVIIRHGNALCTLYHGDSADVLPTLAPVDAVVCDPPYGIRFMNRSWDYDVPSVDLWRLVLAAAKPGAHLLSFAGTRTQHRMAVNIEDAGFEIRDMIMWCYAVGFPKSLDVSKAIDKAAGAEREVVGRYSDNGRKCPKHQNTHATWEGDAMVDITAPATEAAKQWQGWGTALKPALEPITVARKPLIGTVAENVLQHGTGAINVDGCRVGTEGGTTKGNPPKGASNGIYGNGINGACDIVELNAGRWPANLIHDGSDEVVGLFPQTATSAKGPQKYKRAETTAWKERGGSFTPGREWEAVGYGDSGSAARFFYTAKASGEDRGNHTKSALPLFGVGEESWRNPHPTVKPIALMRYLVRLVTPPSGVVIDPFMGSGSTGIAALREGFNFIGIERDPAHFQTACERIEACKSQRP